MKENEERQGRNPRTGETMTIAAKRAAIDAAGAFGLAGLGENAPLVFSGEATAFGLCHDLRIGAGVRGGAGFAVSGTPVALATLGLPPSHRRQSRWGRSGTHMIVHVVHEENLSPPCTVIKERRVSHLCWHGGGTGKGKPAYSLPGTQI